MSDAPPALACPRCGVEVSHTHLPLHPPEVVAARAEDPAFGEVLGRARAKARDAAYDPERDYPWRPAGATHDRVSPRAARRMEKLMEEWERRGERPNRYLRAV